MGNIRPILVLVLAACAIGFGSQAFAQAGIDRGSVTGTVKDPTGAVVPKAQCTLTNRDTGESLEAISTSPGAYSFPLVPVGTYALKVQAPGFKDYAVTGIVVHLGTTVTQDVSLQLGSASVEITVTSAAPLLQAQDASLGTTYDSAAVTELPLFGGSGGRNFENLITTAAGVQFTGGDYTTGTFLVHGVQSGQVDVRLNGTDDNAEVFGGVTIPPIPDAIQEFKLQDGNNSAELGEFYGPVLNVVTKQGTNKFQGSVWEYNENDMFNANDYFNKLHQLVTNATHSPNRPGRYKENSFGGVLGGPVILPGYNGRNRTFFTVDVQRTDYTQSNLWTETVPTATMQNSGFQNLSDTLTLGYQGATGNPLNSMKPDALGREFQVGMMLDPATTRAVPCGAVDPITGLTANCSQGYVVTSPTINGGAKSGVVRDPFLSGAAGCPTLNGSTVFNSNYNTGNGSQRSYSPTCFNQLPAGRLDPNAVALLQLFPKSNQQNASSLTYANNYYIAVPQPTNTTQYDIRIDHKLNDKDSLLGTFSHYLQTSPGAMPLPGILEGGTGANGNAGNFANRHTAFSVVLTETHVFSPSLINEFRFARERGVNLNEDPNNINFTQGIPAKYGIAGIPQTGNGGLGNGGLSDITINSNISSFGTRQNITTSNVGAWMYSDGLTKIRGKHELKVGGEFLWTYGNIAQMPYSRGNFGYGGFSNVPNSGDNNSGMADFLLVPAVANSAYAAAGGLSTSTNLIGGVSSFNGNNFNYSTYHAPYLAFYGVDNWKVTPNFTANLGIRYEYFGPYQSDGGQEANLWMGGAGNSASGTAYYVGHDGCATTMSPFFRGLLAYDNIPVICQSNNAANKTPLANWSPHLGLDYRLRPNLVVRIGAGISYGGFGSIGYGGTLGTNYPFRFSVQNSGASNAYTPNLIGANNNTTATMENTFAVIDLTNPADAIVPLGSQALYGKQYNFHEPHVKNLNAAVQWQFTNHDSVEVRYVGQIGQNLESGDPYNNAPNELLTPNAQTVSLCNTPSNPYCATGFVPFPNLNALTGPMENTEEVSNYQSGEAEYQHQLAYGFNMDANYTFARCWSDAQGGQQNAGGPANGRAPWVTGYRYDYDRCENTAAHVFKLSGEYSLPFGKGSYVASNVNGWQDAIIGGWKLDPIWIVSSGVLANVGCQGAITGGTASSPTYFTGPWFDTNKTAFACDAPLVSGVNPYGPGPRDLKRTRTTGYWNSNALTAPVNPVLANGQADWSPLGARGDQIYGPGWYDVDVNLHKQFKTTEATRLEIGFMALNALNHVQLNNPGTSSYTTTSGESLTGGYGTVTGDHQGNGEGRVLQFVGKFFF